MKQFIYFIISALALITSVFAQTGNHYGGAGLDIGYEVEATSDGGFVVAGRTYSYGAGNMDYWVAKFDSLGNKTWDLPYGTVTYDQLLSLRIDVDGGILLAGLSGVFGSGLEGALLYKISIAGDIVWSKLINYGQADHAHVVFPNYEGGYYMAGHTDSKGDLSGDIWVVKLDSARNSIWDKVYGPQNVSEHAHAAALTPDSGVVAFGHTQVGNHEKFRVVKIDKNGNQQWIKTYSSATSNDDVAYEIRILKNGNFALWGSSIDAVNNSNFWLKIIDPDGNSVLDKHYGTGFSFCWSGRQTSDHGFMMIGYKNPGIYGNEDMLIIKTDSMGTEQWAKQYGGTAADVGYGFVPFRKNDYVLVGSTASFTTFGDEDMWVVLVDSSGKPANFPLVPNDAQVLSVISPSGFYCSTDYTPVIVLKNAGTNELTTVTINYRVDSGILNTYNWTGHLTTGQIDTLKLTTKSISEGIHKFSAWTVLPNSLSDMNSGNDRSESTFEIDLNLTDLPLSEGFESGVFPPAKWRYSGVFGLTSVYPVGAFGHSTKSLKADFANVASGTGILKSPRLNLSGLTSPITLNFSIAYTSFDTSFFYQDNLSVKISDDCGKTWVTLYNSTPRELATTAPVTTEFVPTAKQWRRENINLSVYAGKNILIYFEVTSGYGNNLYLDDINISNAVGLNEIKKLSEIHIYPNPAHNILTVQSPKLSELREISIIDILGSVRIQQILKGGITNINSGDLPDGVYVVLISSEEGNSAQKIIISH